MAYRLPIPIPPDPNAQPLERLKDYVRFYRELMKGTFPVSLVDIDERLDKLRMEVVQDLLRTEERRGSMEFLRQIEMVVFRKEKTDWYALREADFYQEKIALTRKFRFRTRLAAVASFLLGTVASFAGGAWAFELFR